MELFASLMFRTDVDQDQGEPPHDRRACRRLDPHIEGHRGLAEEVYAAFLDAIALIDWLPPGELTGEIHEFDARVGGGYRMSLFYPPDERALRGKTSDREDIAKVRFVELAPPGRIVKAGTFDTADPAFCRQALRAEDNEAGSRLSLEQLAHRLE